MDDSQAAGDIAHARRSEGWPTPLHSAPQLFTDIHLLALSALWTRSVSPRQSAETVGGGGEARGSRGLKNKRTNPGSVFLMID